MSGTEAARRQFVSRLRRSDTVVKAVRSLQLAQFHRDRIRRRKRHPSLLSPITSRPDVLATLRADGVAVMRDAIDPQRLAPLRTQLEACLDAGHRLNPASDDAGRTPGDLGPAVRQLGPDELASGQAALRERTNFLSVNEPFISCPATLDLAFDDLLIDVATEYLDCPPAIGGGNLRKSFVNELPDFDTLYFHSDPNSPKFLKFFFYLHDVGRGGGPFCYVLGSNREKFSGWRIKYRWTQEEIAQRYGEERIAYLTASAGDVVVADTTGFHRGTKVETADRSMLTVDYVVHPEFGGEGVMSLPSAYLAGLEPRKAAAADLLRVANT